MNLALHLKRPTLFIGAIEGYLLGLRRPTLPLSNKVNARRTQPRGAGSMSKAIEKMISSDEKFGGRNLNANDLIGVARNESKEGR